MRPVYRPNYPYTPGYSNTNSQNYLGNRYSSRFSSAPGANIRRPFGSSFPSQFPRPNPRYPMDMINNQYARPQAMIFNNYMGVMQPVLAHQNGQMLMMHGQQYQAWPNQANIQYSNQQYMGVQQVQNNWDPVVSTNLSQSNVQNNWDPAVSTNLSQSTSSSAFATNLTNLHKPK